MPIKLTREQFIRFIYVLLNQERSRKNGMEFMAISRALKIEVESLGTFLLMRHLSDNGKTVVELSHGDNVTFLNEDLFRRIQGLEERRQYRAKWASL